MEEPKKLDLSEGIWSLCSEDNNQSSLGRYKQEIKNIALHLLYWVDLE